MRVVPGSGRRDASSVESAARRDGWPAWSWLYLLLLFGTTLSPLWAHCTPHSWSVGVPFSPVDVCQNVALFVPLGIVLARLSLPRLLLVATLLSASIELVQCWLPRVASPLDVALNIAGALLGRSLSCWTPPELRARWGLACLWLAPATLLGWGVFALARHPASDLSNWGAYPLLIGNELTRDRPWDGLISEIAVYDRARDVVGAAEEDRPAGGEGAGRRLLWLRFRNPAAGALETASGPREVSTVPPATSRMRLRPEGLETGGGLWVLPEEVARCVREGVMASGEFTLRVVLRADRPLAPVPARIVSQSVGTSHRNLTLGQEGSDLVLRVRTPANGPNGSHYVARTTDVPLGNSAQEILASSDGRVARLTVDGRCRGDQHLALQNAPWLVGMGIVPTITLAIASSGLAAASLSRSRQRVVRRLWLLGGGAGVWLLMYGVSFWRHRGDFDVLAALLGILSLAAVEPLLASRVVMKGARSCRS